MNPAALSPVSDQACIFQQLQVVGEPGLRRIQQILKVAHALFTTSETLDDRETGLVGQRVEESDEVLVSGFSRGHIGTYQLFLMGQEP